MSFGIVIIEGVRDNGKTFNEHAIFFNKFENAEKLAKKINDMAQKNKLGLSAKGYAMPSKNDSKAILAMMVGKKLSKEIKNLILIHEETESILYSVFLFLPRIC